MDIWCCQPLNNLALCLGQQNNILDLSQLTLLINRGHINENPSCLMEFWPHMPHLTASHQFCQMNWKTTHRIITKTESLPYFIVKFKIKWPPASWLIIAFSGTGLPVMIQFCLLCLPFFIFKAFFCKFFTLHHKGNTSMPSTLVTLIICNAKCIPEGSNLTTGNVCVCLTEPSSLSRILIV